MEPTFRTPRVLGAIMADSLTEFYIDFDIGTSGEGATCADIFRLLTTPGATSCDPAPSAQPTLDFLGAGATCTYGSTARGFNSRLAVRLGSNGQVVNGQRLMLLPVVRSSQLASEFAQGAFAIAPPANPSTPTLRITGPSVVGMCQPARLGAEILGAGAPFTTAWSLTTAAGCSPESVDAVAAALAAANAVGSFRLELGATDVTPGCTVALAFAARNAYMPASVAPATATAVFFKDPRALPIVTMLTPAALVLVEGDKSTASLAQGQVAFPECLVDRNVSIIWTAVTGELPEAMLSPGAGVVVPANPSGARTIAVSHPRSCRLTALLPGEYTLQLCASRQAMPEDFACTRFTVTVRLPALAAFVNGAAHSSLLSLPVTRAVVAGSVVDPSPSYVLPVGVVPTHTWSCAADDTSTAAAAAAPPCSVVVGANGASAQLVSLSLDVQSYTVTYTYSIPGGRSATAAVRVFPQAVPVPQVVFDAVKDVYDPTADFVVRATVTSESPNLYTWWSCTRCGRALLRSAYAARCPLAARSLPNPARCPLLRRPLVS
jgi:hypothetical protein